MILGIDEAGRGPWAGPLVVGAVVLGGAQIDGLTDSKKIPKKKRESLYDMIMASASATATGWVSSRELDEIGMSQALRLATRRAVEQIRVPYHEIIIDGTVNFLENTTKGAFVTTMPKADLLVPSVSAASIIAKVERDRFMTEQDTIFPGYDFKKHAGYGVAAHRAAIESLGVTPLHRLSFAPLAQYKPATMPTADQPVPRTPQPPSTRVIGDVSEDAAVGYLEANGHKIIARNWKTKWCEVDIITEKNNELCFIEVKHRSDDRAGDGMAAITSKKLRQMRFAAELYAANRPHQILRLFAVSTTGEKPQVIDYLEIIE